MNKKLLRFQNRKLAERIEVRRRVEADLRNRIDQLETRLTTGRYCASINDIFRLRERFNRQKRIKKKQSIPKKVKRKAEARASEQKEGKLEG